MKTMALPAIKTYIHAHVQLCLQFERVHEPLKDNLWIPLEEFSQTRPQTRTTESESGRVGPRNLHFLSSAPSESETVQLSVHKFPFKSVCSNERK